MTAFYIQIRKSWRGQTVGGFLLFAGVIAGVVPVVQRLLNDNQLPLREGSAPLIPSGLQRCSPAAGRPQV